MLVLKRRERQSLHLTIGDVTAVVFVVRVDGRTVTMAVQAPPEVKVLREELVGTSPKAPALPKPIAPAA